MPKNKVEEVSTVTNKYFNDCENKQTVKIAGIVKSIDDKDTPYGTAKRFKGDFALMSGDDTYRAKYLFLPNDIRDTILSEVAKLAKWTSFEFAAILTKTIEDNGEGVVTKRFWSVSFTTKPQIEKARVLALLA